MSDTLPSHALSSWSFPPQEVTKTDLAVLPERLHRWVLRENLPLDAAYTMALYDALADMMDRRDLSYLELPPLVASVAASPFYKRALCYGRGWYYNEMHTLDEHGKLIRDPLHFSRAEIFDLVKDGICPSEKVLLFMPLVWRVGFAVGWLSALSISQKEDVQAAMIILASLVAPLLVPQQAGPGTPSAARNQAARRSASKKQLPAKAKSKFSRKQSKKR